MNVFTKFDEIPSMILQDIKETKCYGQRENTVTVYPPTNTVCGAYNNDPWDRFVHPYLTHVRFLYLIPVDHIIILLIVL